jgi:DNA-binding transcriptional ArsR family regulator
MAKKSRKPSAPPAHGVTVERGVRLYRLLKFLGGGPKTRTALTRHLGLDVRGFYRDLDVLRKAGITVTLEKQRYTLVEDLDDALTRLPFPDPHLTLGEAGQLAKGRTLAHRKLKGQIDELLR